MIAIFREEITSLVVLKIVAMLQFSIYFSLKILFIRKVLAFVSFNGEQTGSLYVFSLSLSHVLP